MVSTKIFTSICSDNLLAHPCCVVNHLLLAALALPVPVRRAFSGNWFRRNFFIPKPLFMNGALLKLSTITQPTDVLWENLGVSERSLFWRRTTTNLLSFLVLLVSFALMYLVELAEHTSGQLCQGELIEQICDKEATAAKATAEAPAMTYSEFAANISAGTATVWSNDSHSNASAATVVSDSTPAACICSPTLHQYELFSTGQTFVWLKTSIVVVLNLTMESLLTYFVEDIERHPSIGEW